MLMVTTADGSRLATEAVGEPLRGDILLVMGATESRAWWPQGLKDALAAAGYRVTSFDHRDTGESTTHAPGEVTYDIFDMTADLVAILDAYGIGAAHFVGMSLGGYLSQIAALQHPERVQSLTLISSEPLGVAYEGEGISPAFMEHFGRMETLDWSDHAAVSAFLLKSAELSAGPALPFDREGARARIALEMKRTSSMQSAFNHSMLGGEIGPELTAERLKLPVLVVHGSADPVISVDAAKTSARVIDGAQLMVLEGRGHELLEQDSDAIAQAIVKLAESGVSKGR